MSQTDAPPSATPFYPGPPAVTAEQCAAYTMQPAHHGTCPNCGRVAFLPHECPPWYTVQFYSDFPIRVEAVSPQEAAELAAERWDTKGGLTHNHGYKVKCKVRDEAGRMTYWEVRGRMLPEYIAQEVFHASVKSEG